jgi:DNA primase
MQEVFRASLSAMRMLFGGAEMRTQWIQDVLDKIDIVDLISDDITLERNKANCPFHQDDTPSFVVHPNTQSFHCFGCQKSGTAIDYIMHRDSLTASEAIRKLCEKYNIPLPTWSEEERQTWERRKAEQDLVTPILHDAFQIYHDEMDTTRRDYFRGRGLTDETIDKELLGYAPDCDNFLFSRLSGKNRPDDLLKSGLFVKLSGRICDAYQRRYLFPYWHQGKIVYSIGRLDTNDPNEIAQLPEWNRGKYKKHLTHNDKHPYVSETISNVIYNADCVRAYKEGIITEGIVDVLLAKQAGFGVISPATTKFADRDVSELSKLIKHCATVYVINDSEVGGEGLEGALKTAETLFKDGCDVRIVTLPRPENVEKVDLADFLNVSIDQKEPRIAELKKLMNEAPNFIELQINEAAKIPEREKPKATEDIFDLFALVDSRLELNRYAELMQKAKLVTQKRLFWGAWRDARIEQGRERKQAHLKQLELTSPLIALKTRISDIRKSEYKKAFEVKREISNLVVEDMSERGSFYKTPEDQCYWFESEAKRLHLIGSEPLGDQINSHYGVNSAEVEYEFLTQELMTKSRLSGTLTEVHKFAYYDAQKYRLYLFNNADQLYRLDGKDIELVDNGTDGVLFLKDQLWEPFEYVGIGEQEFILPLLVNPINFIDGQHVNLNKDEQRFMFTLWLFTLPFESLQPTKPIQVLIGPKGSGKSTAQRIVMKMLFGRRFDVTQIAKEDDFDAAISANHLIGLDNVDGRVLWLNDRLAHTATGKMIQKRELYTTNKNVRFFPKCFLSLNAREPKFKRDDVVDRLLLFRVERLSSFRSEQSIITDILTHRNQLWSEYLNDLNSIVAALAQDSETFTSKHRMADWAELAWRIAKIHGQGDRLV